MVCPGAAMNMSGFRVRSRLSPRPPRNDGGVNGAKRDVKWISETKVQVTPATADVAAVGKLELALQNPNAEPFKKTIDVVEP